VEGVHSLQLCCSGCLARCEGGARRYKEATSLGCSFDRLQPLFGGSVPTCAWWGQLSAEACYGGGAPVTAKGGESVRGRAWALVVGHLATMQPRKWSGTGGGGGGFG
jgi:hypothetical protein